MVNSRLRIRFGKQGDLRWLGHRDLMRAWERTFRRAGIGLRMSEGFHPRPRLVFPSALALGVAGIDEVLDAELDDERSPADVRAALESQLPPGLSVRSVEPLPASRKSARVGRQRFELEIPPERQSRLAERVGEFLAEPVRLVPRSDGRDPVDARPLVEELRLDEGRLRIVMRASTEGGIRPRDLLAALELEDLEQQGVLLTRTAVELEE